LGAEQPTTFTFTPLGGANVHDYDQSNRERSIFVGVGVDMLDREIFFNRFFVYGFKAATKAR